MPYISKEQRELVDPYLATLVSVIGERFDDDEKEGVLNYTITSLLGSLARKNNKTTWRYRYINRAAGVLTCVLQEFYRRLAGPYEDEAIEKNGDIGIYTKNQNVKEEKIYEIYQEGFMIQGMDSPAKSEFVGKIKANSFQEACDKYLANNPNYNSQNLSIWGCKLYQTAEEARKLFG